MKYTFVNILRTAFGAYPYDIKHFDNLDEAKKHLREYKAKNLFKFGQIIESKVFLDNEYEEYHLHQRDPKGNVIDQNVTLAITCNDDNEKETKDNMKIDNSDLYSIYISKHVNSIVTSQLCFMPNLTLKEAIKMRHDLFENFLNNIKNNDTMYRFDNSSESERYCSVMYIDNYTNNANLWVCIVISQDQLRGVHPLGTVQC